MGAQEQAQTQNIINQAMQNYGTAQQYPLMQLGVMSNMLRGLPMQSSTTNMYQAQPSAISQLAGAAGTGLGLYQQGQQAKLFGKEGGVVKMAAGGIATGVDYPTLQKRVQGPSFDDKELAAKSKDTQTDQATKDIMTAEMARRARLRAGAPVMAANGGIIAFKDGEEVTIVDMVSLGINDLIIEENLQHNLDWLHLDTESIDDEIIMSLDFNKINKPKLIVFETINFSEERLGNSERIDKLFDWLRSNGYKVKYDYWNSFAFLH
jgi:hypothetical protein